ncbi:MAG: Synechococcus phage [Pseudomonadota bacterium]|jgi:hypothetical protein
MFVAFEPDDYITGLIELRKSDATRRFRKSIFDDYPLRGPLGQAACAYCGRWNERKLTIDHVVPKSKGGPHFQKGNMVPSCLSCNSSKSNIQVWQWWREQDHWCSDRANLLAAWVSFHSEETRDDYALGLSDWGRALPYLRAA